ncbi:unnamed protein product [Diplocarpon coronariae]|nr:hypothetical protein JHW43_005213 [Diplocarpon mali]
MTVGECLAAGDAPEDDETCHLAAGFEFSPLHRNEETKILSTNKVLSEEIMPKIKTRLREYLTLELNCDWRELYSFFYSEEHLNLVITARTMRIREALVAELKAKVDRGQMYLIVVMRRALVMFGDDDDGSEDEEKEWLTDSNADD